MWSNFLVIAATFLGIHTSLVHEWVRFVDPEGKFEVSLPDSLQLGSDTVMTDVGPLVYVSISSIDTTGGNVVQYSLHYCDYPEGTFPTDSVDLIEAFYDETINASLESVDGELVYEDDARDTYFPTRLWKVTSDKYDLQIKSKALLVHDRYYSLQIVAGVDVGVTEFEGERFFKSFKLVE